MQYCEDCSLTAYLTAFLDIDLHSMSTSKKKNTKLLGALCRVPKYSCSQLAGLPKLLFLAMTLL